MDETRRRLLRAGACVVLAGGCAGCSGDGGDGSGGDPLSDGDGPDGNGPDGDGDGAILGPPARAREDRWPAFRGTPTNSGASAASATPSGTVSWQGRVDGGVVSGVAVTPDAVYVPDDTGVLTALDPVSGTERWRYDAGGGLSAPLVSAGSVYVSTGRTLHAVSTDGDPQWQASLERSAASVSGLPVQQTERSPVVSAPTLADGTLVTGGPRGTVVAVGTDGDHRWTTEVGDAGNASGGAVGGRSQQASPEYLRATPAVRDGTVYVGTADGRVHALAAVDGTEVWVRSVGERVTASVGVPGDTAVVRAGERVVGLDPDSGDVGWEATLSAGVPSGVRPGGPTQVSVVVEASPAVVDDTAYQRIGSRLSAVRAGSGDVDWTTDLAAAASPSGTGPRRQRALPARSSPVVGGGQVAVGTVDGVLAVDADTGDVAWTVPTEAAVFASPAMVDGRVVVADREGRVYGIA